MKDSSDMTPHVRVLYLEDSPQDVALVEAMLAAEGIACHLQWVETQTRFRHALEQPELQLILSDYNLPDFNGLAALHLAHARRPELPFIFVSGAIGEERAIESLQQGATDYVLKQRLSRLGPAVRRALQEVADRHARRAAEERLTRSEAYFRTLTENTSDLIALIERTGVVQYMSPSIRSLLGYEDRDLVGNPWDAYVLPPDTQVTTPFFATLCQSPGSRQRLEFRVRRRDGEVRVVEGVFTNLLDAPVLRGVVMNAWDITDRRLAKAALQETNERLEKTLATERELRNELHRLSSALRRAQETERTRIARELHDGVAQTLSGILLHVDFLHSTTRDPAMVTAVLGEIKEALVRAVHDTREVVWSLRPAILDDLGLREALRGLIMNLMRNTAVEITLQFPEDTPVLSSAVETALYRIVQEALTNALHHGQAARATVRVELDKGNVHVTVTDDGKGFDVTARLSSSTRQTHGTAENNRGIGVWSMRARAEEVGGTFALHSTPGHGTTIHVTAPMQPEGKEPEDY
ncbi:MAG: PAS domain S-box protein [Deltaproteobacteria bacterium]|nr:PAS domain S-box protein [Deltaproteobacteria bacterium]